MNTKKTNTIADSIVLKCMRTILWLIMLSLLTQNAVAANPKFCQRYATTSIRQYEVAVQESMPDIQLPVWSNDYKYHYSWCLRVPQADAQKGITMRDQAIKRFRASKPDTPISGGAITHMNVVSSPGSAVMFDVGYSFASYNPSQGNLTMGGWLYKNGQKYGAFKEAHVYNPVGIGRVSIKVNTWDPKGSDEVGFFLYQGNKLIAERRFTFHLSPDFLQSNQGR